MSKTMKKKGIGLVASVFSLVILVCSFAAIGVMATGSPTASIEPKTQMVGAGESFTFNVAFDPAGKGFTGGSITMKFNASVMRVNAVNPSDLLLGGDGYMELTKEIDNITGTVKYEAIRYPGISTPAPAGNFTVIIATIKEDASSGKYDLNLTDAGFADEEGDPIPGIGIENGSITVDMEKPVIFNLIPANSTILNVSTPTISAEYYDPEPASGINLSSVKISVDSEDVTMNATVTGSNVSYTPPEPLAGGLHSVTVSVADDASNENSTTWSFTVLPRWDVNEDGVVNIWDLTKIAAHYGEITEEPYPRWDVNEDGVVNIWDLTKVAAHYGENYL